MSDDARAGTYDSDSESSVIQLRFSGAASAKRALQSLTVAELQRMSQSAELDDSGRKAELVERLLEHTAASGALVAAAGDSGRAVDRRARARSRSPGDRLPPDVILIYVP